MISNETFRQLALGFPGAVELPHFDRASFRVNKKIFATLLEKNRLAMVKLPLIAQSVFCDYDPSVIYPVPGSWGKQGATYIELKKINKTVLREALQAAYGYCSEKKKKPS